MRKLLIAVSLFLSALVYADKAVIVTLKDGSTFQAFLDESPIMRPHHGKLLFESDALTAEWNLCDVKSFKVDDVDREITSVLNLDNTISFVCLDNKVEVHGCRIGQPIAVYSVSGICIEAFSASDENVSIDLTNQPIGVYTITVGNKAYKLVVK